MIEVGVCDDEEMVAGEIEHLVLDIGRSRGIEVNVDVFSGGNRLEDAVYAGTRYDLLYLDIQMTKGDGITTAERIRQIDENVLFIFVSGYDKYMMELFRLDVFDFIKKPINPAEFSKIFQRAVEKIGSKNSYFLYRYKNEDYKIASNEILYFTSNGRKIMIHMRDGGKYEFNQKLSVVEAQLSTGKIPFLRTHQSFLVNYHMIRSRSRSCVTLVNGEKLPISEERQKEFGRQYSILLGGDIDG